MWFSFSKSDITSSLWVEITVSVCITLPHVAVYLLSDHELSPRASLQKTITAPTNTTIIQNGGPVMIYSKQNRYQYLAITQNCHNFLLTT